VLGLGVSLDCLAQGEASVSARIIVVQSDLSFFHQAVHVQMPLKSIM
jgi:hypothetical protein